MTTKTTKTTVKAPGVFTNINTCICSLTNVVVSTCRTAEKTVNLVENEVDGLAALQRQRLNAIPE